VSKLRLPRLLYHGTSTKRLQAIFAEGILRCKFTGSRRTVSLTPGLAVAEYFAQNAVAGDSMTHPGTVGHPIVVSAPVVLKLSLGREYRLRRWSDSFWGSGQCDWEQEIECFQHIVLAPGTLLAVLEAEPAVVAG